MSQVPYAFPPGRWGARMFNQEMVDLMVFDGLWEIFYGYHMGLTAENIAEKYGITRKDQDELGLISAIRSLEQGTDLAGLELNGTPSFLAGCTMAPHYTRPEAPVPASWPTGRGRSVRCWPDWRRRASPTMSTASRIRNS